MARSVEDIVQQQLGGQALQIARLFAENEMLKEKVSELEKGNQAAKKDVREPDTKPLHIVEKEGKKD